MKFLRSDRQAGSRYKQGGTTDVNGVRLGWWERKIYPKSPSDIPFTLTARYHLRPDLLAADVYGKDSLMWFVLDYNNISDIPTEFIEGAEVILPTRKRLLSELLSATST